MSDTKRCFRCKEVKSLDAFNRDRSRGDGFQPRCRACEASDRKARKARLSDAEQASERDANRLSMRRLRDAWKQADPEGFQRKSLDRFRKWSDANRDSYLEGKRQWLKANPEKNRDYVHRYRARIHAATIGPVDYAAIAERDQNVCHICGYEVDLTVGKHHPMARQFDHVIPLSRGGSHSMQNIHVAHRVCNARKNNKPLSAVKQGAC